MMKLIQEPVDVRLSLTLSVEATGSAIHEMIAQAKEAVESNLPPAADEIEYHNFTIKCIEPPTKDMVQ